MHCRPDCGACCIAPSIARPFFGMPLGKPAGVKCAHLDEALLCALFGDARRPSLCDAFMPDPGVCGANRDEALALITALEVQSTPGGSP